MNNPDVTDLILCMIMSVGKYFERVRDLRKLTFTESSDRNRYPLDLMNSLICPHYPP